jgi:hypothetical protein
MPIKRYFSLVIVTLFFRSGSEWISAAERQLDYSIGETYDYYATILIEIDLINDRSKS